MVLELSYMDTVSQVLKMQSMNLGILELFLITHPVIVELAESLTQTIDFADWAVLQKRIGLNHMGNKSCSRVFS